MRRDINLEYNFKKVATRIEIIINLDCLPCPPSRVCQHYKRHADNPDSILAQWYVEADSPERVRAVEEKLMAATLGERLTSTGGDVRVLRVPNRIWRPEELEQSLQKLSTRKVEAWVWTRRVGDSMQKQFSL